MAVGDAANERHRFPFEEGGPRRTRRRYRRRHVSARPVQPGPAPVTPRRARHSRAAKPGRARVVAEGAFADLARAEGCQGPLAVESGVVLGFLSPGQRL